MKPDDADAKIKFLAAEAWVRVGVGLVGGCLLWGWLGGV